MYYVGMLPQLRYDSEVPNALDPMVATQGLVENDVGARKMRHTGT